jgi:hypothetical protein
VDVRIVESQPALSVLMGAGEELGDSLSEPDDIPGDALLCGGGRALDRPTGRVSDDLRIFVEPPLWNVPVSLPVKYWRRKATKQGRGTHDTQYSKDSDLKSEHHHEKKPMPKIESSGRRVDSGVEEQLSVGGIHDERAVREGATC